MKTILAVDDTPENLDVLRATFGSEFRLKVATDGAKALQIAWSSSPPDIILLDVMMPDMDGFEVCRRLKSDPRTSKIPVIFITALGHERDQLRGLELGAVDYLQKPINPMLARVRVKNQLELYDRRCELEVAVAERTRELTETRMQIIFRLGRAAEFKDNETGDHILRMSEYSRILARQIGLDDGTVELIYHASPMHDIGKIGIPDRVLMKPGKLDAEEWEKMRQHPQLGADIIGIHEDLLLQAARDIALTHHEKWDGSGYPNQLKTDEIPLFGRIVALADVFDALTSVRPYKPAWTVEDAVALIRKESGSHFDPLVVDAFNHSIPLMVAYKQKLEHR
jgi:putative two-component system response regulator